MPSINFMIRKDDPKFNLENLKSAITGCRIGYFANMKLMLVRKGDHCERSDAQTIFNFPFFLSTVQYHA